MIKPIIENWKRQLEESQKHIDNFRAFFNCVECDIVDAFEALQIEYTVEVAERVGDKSGWLMWFWLENGLGKKAMEAGYNGNFTRVTDIDVLVDLIEKQK